MHSLVTISRRIISIHALFAARQVERVYTCVCQRCGKAEFEFWRIVRIHARESIII